MSRTGCGLSTLTARRARSAAVWHVLMHSQVAPVRCWLSGVRIAYSPAGCADVGDGRLERIEGAKGFSGGPSWNQPRFGPALQLSGLAATVPPEDRDAGRAAIGGIRQVRRRIFLGAAERRSLRRAKCGGSRTGDRLGHAGPVLSVIGG